MPSGDKRKYGLKYSEAGHLRIVQAVKLGATMDMAAKAGGVSVRTLRAWLADARRNGEESPFYKLLQDVQEADGASGINALACIQKAAKEGKWQAAAWLLERKHGFRRDGVRESQPDAVALPGSLETHQNELIAETRRLRIAAQNSGSHVAAANLLRMEHEMVHQAREEAERAAARTLTDAGHDDLLDVIRGATSDLPKKVLDEVHAIIEAQRKKAS